MTVRYAALWTLSLLGLACSLDEVDLDAKTACPCASEYVCVQGVCRPLDQASDVLPADGVGSGGTDAVASPPPPPLDAGRDPVSVPDSEPPVVAADAAIDAGPVCPELPLSPGACPSVCNGGCDGGVCTIQCDAFQKCMLTTTTCPAGWPCRVECSGPLACAVPGQIICADGPCDIRCTGTGACGSALVTCGSGPCSIACTTSIVPPVIECGASCGCAGVCEELPPG